MVTPSSLRMLRRVAQESHCPLPPGSEAVHSRGSTAHCPQAVRQCIAGVPLPTAPCVLSAAAAGALAGVVAAFAEPSGPCAGAVLNVAWCAVCASVAPSRWRIEDVLVVAGVFDCFCRPRASVHRPSRACLTVFLCA